MTYSDALRARDKARQEAEESRQDWLRMRSTSFAGRWQQGMNVFSAAMAYAEAANRAAEADEQFEELCMAEEGYISRQPCTCTEDEPCERCLALGRYFDKRNDR